MCSIAGIVWDTPHSADRTLELVRVMNRALRHRGPDGEGAGVVADGSLTVHHFRGDGSPAAPSITGRSDRQVSLALGMNRLAIRDIEGGLQPMLDESRRVMLVFNGEIYNCGELVGELTASGARFKTHSDTEVILEAYLKWGRRCVERLAGMFAFAIWDDRDGSLFIARDRLGIKPLVWARAGGALVFGSELKSLLATGLVERRVRPSAIDAYLFHLHVPAPAGPLEEVNLLEPGHTLLFKDGRVHIERYWTLSFAPGERRSLAEHGERFRSLLEQAVESHLVSDVPIGAFLSGGLDSSAIAALMKRLGAGDVRTYTVGFDVDAYDESADAAAAARHIGTVHQAIPVSLSSVEDDIVKVLRHYDQPFADSSAVPTYVLCRETARHVKVALAGDGSDEQLAGYPRARQFLALEVMRRAPSALRDALGWAAERAAPALGKRARRARNLADFTRALRGSGRDAPMEAYVHLRHAFRNGWHEALLTPELAAQVSEAASNRHVHDVARASRAKDALTKMLEVEVHTYLPNDILQKVDIASGAHGLEVRVPFLDHRLVEAVAAMPVRAKLSPTETKVVLRRALADVLPPGALKKKKQGFHLPVADWLRGRGRAVIEDVLLSPRAHQRGYFKREVVERMAREHASLAADHGSMLWALLHLELWHRTWVDAAPETNVA